MKTRFIQAFLLSLFLIFLNFSSNGQFLDTSRVDVLHYNIRIDSISIPARYLKASCKIVYRITKPTSQAYFMLKSLTIDSIASHSGSIQNYLHKSPDIIINYKSNMPVGYTDSFTVYYQGKPIADSWGGFYFNDANGGYAFNMGIAMADFPHAYGRVWFPCIDLFSDRSTYTVTVKTLAGQTAMSGGLLKSRIQNPDNTLTWTWEIQKPVATDLLSIAVGPYAIVKSMHTGVESTYPIVYGVLPSDSLKMQSSFANIHQAINIFETKYGPYRFDKVGFSVVPFSGGAMEHSENISYPKNTIDGTKNYESLWSHELSHSWWGNLVKCYTSDDMWLNEGWASFSEYVFTEGVYGRQAYLNQVHAEQKNVLQYAHINDESALPLAPLPTQYTYGSTAYQKGAVIVHTLLTYMGDSLFYDACRKYLAAMAFKNHNSYQLRDSFSKYSGINLNDFFNDWVFKPGFPHFEIINTSYNQSLSEYTVNIRQNSRFNSSLYHNVPLKVSFYNDGFERFDYMINVNGYESAYQVKTHWQASLIALNADVDLSEAIGKNYTEISSTGSITLDEAMMTIKVDALPSKAFIFAEHHWIGPDHTLTETKGIRFSDYRYWTVDGIFPAGFKAEATLRYNGTESAIDGTNYLDHTLNIQNEDSLVLLYRPNKLSPWTNIKNTNATFSTFSKTDKKGSIKVINLQKGDYCLGKFDHSASTGSIPAKKDFRIYPNPARSELVIDISDNPGYYKSLKLIDSSGKIIFSGVIDNNPFIKIETSSYNKGMYIAEIITTDNVLCEKFIIE